MFRRLLSFVVISLSTVAVSTASSEVTAPQSQPSTEAKEESRSIVTPGLEATGEYWDNCHGGIQKGSRWETLVDASACIALNRLGGAQNSELFLQFWWVKNQKKDSEMSALTGASNDVSGIKASDETRIMNFFYKQAWDDGALSAKLGLLIIDDDFLVSEYGGLFSNASFGTIPAEFATPLATALDNHAAFASYPLSSPGFFLAAKPSEHLTTQIGLYHGGPGPDTSDNHGFDWDRLSAAGAVLFAEAAWKTKLGTLDSSLHTGASYHTGTFDDFRNINQGQTDATVRGLFGIYVFQDLTLATDEKENPKWGLFWHTGLSPQSDRAVVRSSADVGINWFGPVPGRPKDVAGTAFSWTEFGAGYREHVGTGVLARTETVWETTYRAEVSEHWFVQADLQWLGRPSDPTGAGRHENATVLGLRTVVSF